MNKTHYTAEVIAEGGRSGRVDSDDGELKLHLAVPYRLTEEKLGKGTNPEQLFAAAYSSSYFEALKDAAEHAGIPLKGATVIARVTLIEEDSGAERLGVELRLTLPGIVRHQAEKLSNEAHATCPYSKAIKGNLEVKMMYD